MRIALAQINPTVGDFQGNLTLIKSYAEEAARRGAELVVFPELCLTGYPPQDLIEKESFLQATQNALQQLIAETSHLSCGLIVGYVGRANREGLKKATNSAALIEAGRLVFRQDKWLLPTYDVFDEARYFVPAEKQAVCVWRGKRLAITICEDAWNDKHFWKRQLYDVNPIEHHVQQGAELLITINSSPYQMGKRSLREGIFQSIAQNYGLPAIYVNQVGGNDQLVFDGSSFAVDSGGRVYARAASFREDLVVVDAGSFTGEFHGNFENELEAAYEALVLGTRDYLRKCGFDRVVIGLSGGIDSSLTAVIATDAVGPRNVTGVAMPGPYSSEASLKDAQELAKNLGIRFLVIPITDMFRTVLSTLEPVFQNLPPDVTEENIQARLRGLTLMALSNKWGALVLSTGNKSELAVGYCTLYGDMTGGLAVISDVPKTMVYKLARLANQRHGKEVIPESVFRKPPSAELRPNQKDTDSLPEYEVLDRILHLYVEELKEPEEIARQTGLPLELVRHVANLVMKNEYKRKQAPPGLKITSRAFGMGWRFPIAHKFAE